VADKDNAELEEGADVTSAEEPVAEETPAAASDAAAEPAAEAEAAPEVEAEAAPEVEAEAAPEAEDEEKPAAKPKAAPKPKAEAKPAPRKKTPRAKPAAKKPAAKKERGTYHREPKPVREPGRRKERRGVVTSDKGDKTITIRVDTAKPHPKYLKIVRRSTKIHAHDERNQAKVGDVVRVVECRPLSATKRWRLVEILEEAR
jgi:small subunit ribosomal protein S17